MPSEAASDGCIETLVALLDGDGSGTLNVQELADFVERGTDTFPLGKQDIMDHGVAVSLQGALQAALTYERLFNRFDKSGDGLLNTAELLGLFRKYLGITPAEASNSDIALLVKALDDDGSGTLAIAELVSFVESLHEATGKVLVDDDTAGVLQAAFREKFRTTPLLELYKKYDKSGDGQLDYHGTSK